MDNTILVSGITGELGRAMSERMAGVKQTAAVIIRRLATRPILALSMY